MRPGGAVFGTFPSDNTTALLKVPLHMCSSTCSEARRIRVSAVGSLVGAGGVTAYNTYHSNDWGIVKTLQWWIEKGQADTARANNPELARLEDMVMHAVWLSSQLPVCA